MKNISLHVVRNDASSTLSFHKDFFTCKEGGEHCSMLLSSEVLRHPSTPPLLTEPSSPLFSSSQQTGVNGTFQPFLPFTTGRA